VEDAPALGSNLTGDEDEVAGADPGTVGPAGLRDLGKYDAEFLQTLFSGHVTLASSMFNTFPKRA
jgi:hypothetical protein